LAFKEYCVPAGRRILLEYGLRASYYLSPAFDTVDPRVRDCLSRLLSNVPDSGTFPESHLRVAFCRLWIERSAIWSSGERKSGKQTLSFELKNADVTSFFIDANASLRLPQPKDPEHVVRRGPTCQEEYLLNISFVLKCG
jgi:hypothetical protein